MSFYDNDGMPPLVDANSVGRMGIIPPPAGATYSATNSHAFPGAFAAASRPAAGYPSPYGHGPPPFAGYPSPHAPDSFGWQQPQQPYPQDPNMPSPYIPRHNLYDTPPQLQPQPQHQRTQSTILRRTNSHSTPSSAGRRRATSVSAHSPWRVWDDEPPSSFDLPSATPSTDHIGFTLPSSFTAPNTLLHTPSSTLSRTASMSGYHPPTDRPTTWRRDFKFRSGLSSIFRLKGSNSRSNELSDSSKLSLHPYLRHDRSLPPTILDLRREPSQTLVFREIDHPVGFDDMIHSCTNPPTPFMRIYHSRLPWYIDIHASGNPPYVTLADLFLGLYTSLSARIHRSDYYNDELNAEDREILKKAWEERCRSPEESADGVKRVDYLRGKVIFEGLVRGKNGMWQLKTGREYS